MKKNVKTYRTLWRSFLLNDHGNVRLSKKRLDKCAISVCNSPGIQNAEKLLYKITYGEVTDFIREFISSHDINSPTISSSIYNLVLAISRAIQCLPNCFRLMECRNDVFPDIRLASRRFLIHSLKPHLNNIYRLAVARYIRKLPSENFEEVEVVLNLCFGADAPVTVHQRIRRNGRWNLSKKIFYFKKAADVAIECLSHSSGDITLTGDKEVKFQDSLKKLHRIAELLGDVSAQYVNSYFLKRTLPRKPGKYFSFLSNIKLTSSALVYMYHKLPSPDDFKNFKAEFLRQRSIYPGNWGWNAILNAIDLSDTFEDDPCILYTSSNEMFAKTAEPVTILETDDRILLRTMINPMKRQLRENFKLQIEDTPKFLYELSKVLSKVLKLYDKSLKDRHMRYEYRDLFNATLSLVLNYTPQLDTFIAQWYIPLLIRRIYKYGPIWYEDYDTPGSFDSTILKYIPEVLFRKIRKLIEAMRDPIRNPLRLTETGIEFSFIALEKSEVSFNIQNSGVIWPNDKFKELWDVETTKISYMGKVVGQGSDIHYVEISSPFPSAGGDPDGNLRIKLPLSCASILCCYNDADSLTIKELRDKLKITEEYDQLFLRSLRTLVRAGLLLREKLTFSLNVQYKADEKVIEAGLLII